MELLLVITILGLLAAVAIPSLPGALDSARLQGSAREVRATFNLARALAVSNAGGRNVIFDIGKGEYGIEGEAHNRMLPENVRLSSIRLGDSTAEHGVVRVRFHPDGSADEAYVTLSLQEGGSVFIRIDPLTGMAAEGA